MYLNAETDLEARLYICVNENTGLEIPDVVWANDETGEYGQLVREKDRGIKTEFGKPVIAIKKGKIRLDKVHTMGIPA